MVTAPGDISYQLETSDGRLELTEPDTMVGSEVLLVPFVRVMVINAVATTCVTISGYQTYSSTPTKIVQLSQAERDGDPGVELDVFVNSDGCHT